VKIVAGLGNPGRRYLNTRHNVGFRVVDELAKRYRVAFRKGWRAKSYSCKIDAGEDLALLVKPQTYMNRSGTVVCPLMRRKGIGPQDLIAVVDDVDLPCGRVRVRSQGGAGGHKGLRSIIQQLGTNEFARVRVGIGRAEPKEKMVDFVLSDFTTAERDVIEAAVSRAADAVLSIISTGADTAMNEFNGT